MQGDGKQHPGKKPKKNRKKSNSFLAINPKPLGYKQKRNMLGLSGTFPERLSTENI